MEDEWKTKFRIAMTKSAGENTSPNLFIGGTVEYIAMELVATNCTVPRSLNDGARYQEGRTQAQLERDIGDLEVGRSYRRSNGVWFLQDI